MKFLKWLKSIFSFEYNIGRAHDADSWQSIQFVPSEAVPENEVWFVNPDTGETTKLVNIGDHSGIEKKDET